MLNVNNSIQNNNIDLNKLNIYNFINEYKLYYLFFKNYNEEYFKNIQNKLENEILNIPSQEKIEDILKFIFNNKLINKNILFCYKFSILAHWNNWISKIKNNMSVNPYINLICLHNQCGQSARLIYDLFNTNGYKCRLVQLYSHVACEIFINNKWLFLDCNSNKNVNIKNHSLSEIQDNPSVVDKDYYEIDIYLRNFIIKDKKQIDKEWYPYFYSNKFIDITIYDSSRYYLCPYWSWYFVNPGSGCKENENKFYIKNKNMENIYFGWNDYKTIITDRKQIEKTKYFLPGSTKIKSINIIDNKITIEWYKNLHNDIKFYKIYLSSVSRDWNYFDSELKDRNEVFYNKILLENYDFDKINSEPPNDILIDYTEELKYTIEIDKYKTPIYISICAVDNYGYSIDRKIYVPSIELKI